MQNSIASLYTNDKHTKKRLGKHSHLPKYLEINPNKEIKNLNFKTLKKGVEEEL